VLRKAISASLSAFPPLSLPLSLSPKLKVRMLRRALYYSFGSGCVWSPTSTGSPASARACSTGSGGEFFAGSVGACCVGSGFGGSDVPFGAAADADVTDGFAVAPDGSGGFVVGGPSPFPPPFPFATPFAEWAAPDGPDALATGAGPGEPDGFAPDGPAVPAVGAGSGSASAYSFTDWLRDGWNSSSFQFLFSIALVGAPSCQ